MSKFFYRPSALGNINRFLANAVLGTQEPPSKFMKRGTAAEEIAILGSAVAKKRWVIIPSLLPLDAAGKRIYATWDKWEQANGVSRDADNCIDEDSWNQANYAARAIRQALTQMNQDFQYQVKGSMELNVQVPSGYSAGMEGTCDILAADGVIDIKVISRTTEGDEERLDPESLLKSYRLQVSAYALIQNKPAAYLLVVFPIDPNCLMWDFEFIPVPLASKEEIEARCASLFASTIRLAEGITNKINLSEPYSAKFALNNQVV